MNLPVVPNPPSPDNATQADEAQSVQAFAQIIADPLMVLKLKPQVIEALSTVYDPEIPVNIYELGLIYDINANASGTVGIRMTLTAPGCPAAQSLPAEVQKKVEEIPGVTRAIVEVVWDPPWDRDRMSEVAKLQLGMF